MKSQEKNQSVTEYYGTLDTNAEYLSYRRVEVLEYFKS